MIIGVSCTKKGIRASPTSRMSAGKPCSECPAEGTRFRVAGHDSSPSRLQGVESLIDAADRPEPTVVKHRDARFQAPETTTSMLPRRMMAQLRHVAYWEQVNL